MPISKIETASLDAGLIAPTATALTTASALRLVTRNGSAAANDIDYIQIGIFR